MQRVGDDFFDVLFMFARKFFYLQCFLFVKAVSPVGHRRKGPEMDSIIVAVRCTARTVFLVNREALGTMTVEKGSLVSKTQHQVTKAEQNSRKA